jgi:hypothetical protein
MNVLPHLHEIVQAAEYNGAEIVLPECKQLADFQDAKGRRGELSQGTKERPTWRRNERH